MHLFHLPVIEIIRLFLQLRHNRPFMRISRILMLTMVVVSSISYFGAWVNPIDINSPACYLGKSECYQGPSMPFSEVIFHMGGLKILLLLPLIDLSAALLLLFKPPRTYLILWCLSFISTIAGMALQPDPYLYFSSGSGEYLHLLCNSVLFFLAFPLAFDEQVKHDPNWDYEGF